MKSTSSRLEWLTFQRLSTALLFLAIALAACFSPAQNDTWWQLRTGQEIWNTRTIDLSDHFSHTASGAYWPNHEWLSQVLFYAVYRIGGLRLSTALVAGLILGAWVLVWRLSPGEKGPRFILCALALVPSSSAWSLRPQVLTLFFLAATAFLIVRRWYLLMPPVFLLWANLHGGVTLGFPLLAGWIAALVVEERRLPMGALAIAVLCFLATAMTPLGVSLWTEVPATLARTRPYGIMEWRPPGLTELRFIPFWLLAGVLVALVIKRRPWQTASPAGPMIWTALAMLPLAVASERNVPPFLLMAVPAVAAMGDWKLESPLRASRRVERPALNAGVLLAGVVLAAGTVAYAWSSEASRLEWHPLPAGAIAAIASCPERLYNRYDEGGYLIWFVPNRKVFIDSRQDPYPSSLVRDQIRVEASGDYAELFDRYSIACAFVAADSPIAVRLMADGWQSAYTGSGWSVMTRN
jgi:hypothetical protein